MGDLAVSVRGLSKQYRVTAAPERYSTLRDQIRRAATAPLRVLLQRAQRSDGSAPFWALKDVTFDVRRGEVLGIIGRNGAGKSTLLKVLSRVTEPTEGEADIRGRVGSLLEVGTGFHPELTGRENVFLNGAILGMRRAEITRKFDEIVAFAEMNKFIDTPVKHYSSGMYMRLAFAVAAHLEPEILIVDEVLAVGDAHFQDKCLGKMGEVAKGGRTVLFVSHNMAAVRALCTVSLLLDSGKVRMAGPVDEVVAGYMGLAPHERVEFPTSPLTALQVSQRGPVLEIRAEFRLNHPLPIACLGFVISDLMGNPVCGTNPRLDGMTDFGRGLTVGAITATLQQPKLRDGRYRLSVWFGDGTVDLFAEHHCLTFDVSQMTEHGRAAPSTVGTVIPACAWEVTGR